MEHDTNNLKRVRITVEAYVVQEQEGTTTFKLVNGFGDLETRFDDARFEVLAEAPAA